MQSVTTPLPVDRSHHASPWIASIRRTFPDHLPLYVCSYAFCAAILGIAAIYRVPLAMDAGMATAFGVLLVLFAGFIVLGLFVGTLSHAIDRLRGKTETAAPREWLAGQLMRGDRPGNGFHALMIFVPLLAGCDAVKEVITRIHPFSWDATFAHWGRVLGLGEMPWQRLMPVTGHPAVIAGFNFFYDIWFMLVLGSLLWEAFSPRRDSVRMQYLIAFAFVWFLAGTVLAILFSSAGPCYYGKLHLGPDPYAAQMDYLRSVAQVWPVWSLHLQDALWNAYAGKAGAISGISAMPSVHVTASVLLALLGLRRNRAIGVLLSVYAAIIYVGSIALAWHYAVDGIAGAALAVIFWYAAGLIARAKWKETLPASAAVARAMTRMTSAVAARIAATFAGHLPLYASSILFGIATWTVADYVKAPVDLASSSFFIGMAFSCLVIGTMIVALIEFIRLVASGCPDQPLQLLWRRLTTWFDEGERLGNLFHTVIAFSLLAISFTTLKEAIPQIHPFDWDKTFVQWDRVIGFGRLPWEWLQPLLGYAPVTTAISFAYDCWFFVMFGCLFWAGFSSKGSAVRTQFLLAFAFAWFFAGNVLATVFSSAGPCFYGFLHPGHDPYAAQMAYLHAARAGWPIWSVDVQDMLWKSYAAGHGTLGGISAMPSMHVTVAVLLAIWGWRVNRWTGAALTAFAALIVIGSVHLAWHYAVDGIAGSALAAIFWSIAGVLARAWERWLSRRALPAHGALGGSPA
ncbi:MAG TPA: phosphatase PAP2 family protein [Rhizomicrobium sp.]|nr:phosphatase PAP2 family protein [Rhizomicrobium sp.]